MQLLATPPDIKTLLFRWPPVVYNSDVVVAAADIAATKPNNFCTAKDTSRWRKSLAVYHSICGDVLLLDCIESMRCRLLLPMCADSVSLSLCPPVCLSCRGHSVQPLPNYFGLLVEWACFKTSCFTLMTLVLVQWNKTLVTPGKTFVYRPGCCCCCMIMMTKIMLCRDKVSNQVDGAWSCLWTQVQCKVRRLVVRRSTVWNCYFRTHALPR